MKYAHGDLNPLNAIISQNQRINLSTSGLSKFCYTKFPSNDLSINIPDICKRKYWLLVRTDDETNGELIADHLFMPQKRMTWLLPVALFFII
jgi:hypothetical protein